jgi:hypothetical protein
MKMTSKEFRTKLNAVKKQILARIKEVMGEIGTKVCVRMYHEYDITDTQYTYFEVDGDGYGRELFVDTVNVSPNGDIDILLHDSEDCYEPMWCLEDLNTTDALYLLEELEEIADFHKKNPGKEVLTEYDADFDWENY